MLALWPVACAPAPAQPAWDLVLAAPAGATADAAQTAADAYAQATGLRVRVQTFPGDAYLDHIFAALLAGSGEYDLVYLSAESLPKWAGYHTLQPLTLTGDENTAPWLPLVMVEEEVFGVPVEPDVDVLWYRKDLFEAAGIRFPLTWITIYEDVRYLAVDVRERWAIALSGGELDAGRDLAALLGETALIERSGDAWRVNASYSDLRGSLTLYAWFLDRSGIVNLEAVDWTRADVQKALATDQAAMGILPLSAASDLLDCEHSPDVCKDGKSLLAFAPLPGMEDTLGVGSVQAWAVPLKAPHPDAAQAFAAWLASEDGARAWANGGGMPAHRTVLAEMNNPAAQALAEVTYFRPAFPPLIPAAEIWQALHIAGHGAAEGEPPELLVEELVRSMATALRQSGYTVIEE